MVEVTPTHTHTSACMRYHRSFFVSPTPSLKDFITCILCWGQYHCVLGFEKETVSLHRRCFLPSSLYLSLCLCQVLERRRLQKRLLSPLKAPESDVGRSGESDGVPQSDEDPEQEEDRASRDASKEKPVTDRDLRAQVCATHKPLRQIIVFARITEESLKDTYKFVFCNLNGHTSPYC